MLTEKESEKERLHTVLTPSGFGPWFSALRQLPVLVRFWSAPLQSGTRGPEARENHPGRQQWPWCKSLPTGNAKPTAKPGSVSASARSIYVARCLYAHAQIHFCVNSKKKEMFVRRSSQTGGSVTSFSFGKNLHLGPPVSAVDNWEDKRNRRGK